MFSIQLKKNLSYLEKVVNIEDQSFFIFTNQNNRLCFHNFIHACLGRPSVMTKSLKKIDTEQIRNRLKEITEFFKQHLGIQHLQDYRLLNKAILKYNHLVPDHLLPVVLPLQLKELAECIPLPIIKLECKPFQAPTEKKLGVLEYFGVKSEEYLPIYKKYTSIGGEVTVLPGLKNGDRWNNPIEIISGDHFKEVCHAGLVRSQIMNLVLTLVKQVSFGTPTGMERVSPAHGVERGNDGPLNNFENDFREEFERAFGVNRESRFGHEASQKLAAKVRSFSQKFFKNDPSKEMHYYFDQHFYAHSNSNPFRKIFFTFAETGLTIMNRLYEVNKNKGLEALRGTYVVIIPEGDWISYSSLPFEILWDLHTLNLEQKYSQYNEYTLKEIEKSFWYLLECSTFIKKHRHSKTSINTNNLPSSYKDALKIFHTSLKNEIPIDTPNFEQYQSFFKTLAYRMAFLRFASIVQPVREDYSLSSNGLSYG